MQEFGQLATEHDSSWLHCLFFSEGLQVFFERVALPDGEPLVAVSAFGFGPIKAEVWQ